MTLFVTRAFEADNIERLYTGLPVWEMALYPMVMVCLIRKVVASIQL
jgi:hypothetical protein